MGSNTYVSGSITFNPPATWNEVLAAMQRTDKVRGSRRFEYDVNPDARSIDCGDVTLTVTVDEQNTADGLVTQRRFVTAVGPGSEEPWPARDFEASLAQVAADFATAPDGTPRRFAGHLQTEFKDEFYMTRCYLVDGELVEHVAEIVWPAAPASTQPETGA